MGKGNKEGTSKQFRWTKPMEHLFLEILAEEAQKGNKPSNSFKAFSINRVAEAISERFQVHCDAKHMENHLRTVKNQWQIICTIRDQSGFGWDDNMKMITCDRATYDAAVMAHKKYEPFLNKSIDHYDEMALVVGKDMATGSFARTFADIDLDDDNIDSVPIDCKNEATEEVEPWVELCGTTRGALRYTAPVRSATKSGGVKSCLDAPQSLLDGHRRFAQAGKIERLEGQHEKKKECQEVISSSQSSEQLMNRPGK
ncbi:hypothetical protein J1N35_025098 [Gossypium stocksii]|uniref:Myb/SANT-like domain-containing protein n=1 Tax=Gossypium stocksii TaxID=47602 RepID=A0A9D3V6B2_9ROSI|nr:hypothetical protein J1N35_025098 [Gossypium stocksii]